MRSGGPILDRPADPSPLDAPGNVLIPAKVSGLPKDSVANVSQVFTVDREFLHERVSQLQGQTMKSLDAGLRLVLGL